MAIALTTTEQLNDQARRIAALEAKTAMLEAKTVALADTNPVQRKAGPDEQDQLMRRLSG